MICRDGECCERTLAQSLFSRCEVLGVVVLSFVGVVYHAPTAHAMFQVYIELLIAQGVCCRKYLDCELCSVRNGPVDPRPWQ